MFHLSKVVVDVHSHKRSCYVRWERRRERLLEKEGMRSGKELVELGDKQGRVKGMQLWLSQQNQRWLGVQMNVARSSHRRLSTNLKASKVPQSSRSTKPRQERCKATVDHMIYPHPLVRVVPHPQESGLTKQDKKK